MGYYTLFEVEAFDATNFPKEQNKIEEDILVEMFNNILGPSMKYDYFEESIKWYEWDKDMTKLSKSYPDIVFSVVGDGEESDDNWKSLFYNGKQVYSNAITSFPPMDLSKIGLSDPDDYAPPEPTPENQYFFSKE